VGTRPPAFLDSVPLLSAGRFLFGGNGIHRPAAAELTLAWAIHASTSSIA